MDVNMPLMDGLQATQEIKKIDPDPIIIINTAYNERSDLNLALQSGADGFIEKPILPLKLFKCLFRIRKKRSSSPNSEKNSINN